MFLIISSLIYDENMEKQGSLLLLDHSYHFPQMVQVLPSFCDVPEACKEVEQLVQRCCIITVSQEIKPKAELPSVSLDVGYSTLGRHWLVPVLCTVFFPLLSDQTHTVCSSLLNHTVSLCSNLCFYTHICWWWTCLHPFPIILCHYIKCHPICSIHSFSSSFMTLISLHSSETSPHTHKHLQRRQSPSHD